MFINTLFAAVAAMPSHSGAIIHLHSIDIAILVVYLNRQSRLDAF
ncbi:MAG: hypothetical protein ACP5I8_17065 [Phycisphaerae bacterium]